jgi:hypothetical protein
MAEKVSVNPDRKIKYFRPFQTKTHGLGNNLKSLRAFQTVPSRRVAAAPIKNIENNPMQSSRRRPQPATWTENLTRRANQRHNFIIPEFAKRRRAQY